MGMGDAKQETVVDINGKHISRIPQKPLNRYIKATLLTLLKRDDIKIKVNSEPGSSTVTVTDSNDKFLFAYDNAWDYGYYRIFMANPKEGAEPILVAEMDWYERDGYTNYQQQDIFDVSDALGAKLRQLEFIESARNNLTPEEIQAIQALGIAR
ncbi:MAG: hypothetical protein IJ560_03265 [Alphaproteobacteria bacterium]|nr:hypothetical protein [Alphaproteobacteria bacterium]